MNQSTRSGQRHPTQAPALFALLLGTAMLGGCSTSIKAQAPYWGAKPTRVVLEAAAMHVPAKLDVYFHPDDPSRAAVWPPFGAHMGIALKDGTDPWIATVDTQRAAYEKILLDVLHRSRRQCQVSQATPYPEMFMFEFTYACQTPAAPPQP